MDLKSRRMESVSKIFDERPFYILKKLEILLGVWPYESRRKKIFHRCCWFIILSVHLTPMVKGIKTFYGKDMATCLQCIIESIFVSEHLIIYWYILPNEEKMKKLHEKLAENWILVLPNQAEHKILEEFANKARIIYLSLGALVMYTVACLYVLPPVMQLLISLTTNQTEERIMSLKGDYLIDQHVYYYHLNVLYSILAFLDAIIVITFIGLEMAFILQGFAYFKVTSYRIKTAVQCNDFNKARNELLVQAARMHQIAFEYTGLLKDAYSLILFLILTTTCCLMTITVACIACNTDNFHELLKFTVAEISLFMQLFVLCWPGQQMMDYSLNVYSCSYNCDWYLQSKQNRQLFEIIMMRSLKPFIGKAAGIIPSNYETFLSVTKTSLSCMAIAISVLEKSN